MAAAGAIIRYQSFPTVIQTDRVIKIPTQAKAWAIFPRPFLLRTAVPSLWRRLALCSRAAARRATAVSWLRLTGRIGYSNTPPLRPFSHLLPLLPRLVY